MGDPNFPRLSTLAAALTIGVCGLCHAGDGETLAFELPSFRTQVETMSAATDGPAATTAAISVNEAGAPASTRSQVRAELKAARESGTISLGGEMGDSEAVLAAREKANEDQAELIAAKYRAEQERVAAADAALTALAIALTNSMDGEAAVAGGEAAYARAAEDPIMINLFVFRHE